MIHTIGMILFAIGVAMAGAAVLAFADVKRTNNALNEQGDLGADWGGEHLHNETGL